jgi:autophagy-related protein 18
VRLAICALAPSSENSYLAYPSPLPSPTTPLAAAPSAGPISSSQAAGDVLLFDAISLSVTNIIQAHKSPLAAVSINPAGTLLATASDKGTVIRVFGIPNGDKVAQFRRGSYPARIFSISFNAVSSLLCVSSDTETVHIFKFARGGGGGKPSAQQQQRSLGRASAPAEFGDDGGSSSTSSYSNWDSPGGGRVGGYEAFIDSRRNGGGGVGSASKPFCSTFVLALVLTFRQGFAQTQIVDPRAERRGQRGRLLAQHAH